MTPKEKAEELVHRFDIMQTYIKEFTFEDAKQCASIAVDEIKEFMSLMVHSKQAYDYWDEVKTEIYNLN